MQADRELDACRCAACTGKTIETHLARDLRRAFPPAGECPEEIVEALLRIDAAYVERVEPLALPRDRL